jgi:hypothetical protein
MTPKPMAPSPIKTNTRIGTPSNKRIKALKANKQMPVTRKKLVQPDSLGSFSSIGLVIKRCKITTDFLSYSIAALDFLIFKVIYLFCCRIVTTLNNNIAIFYPGTKKAARRQLLY